MGLPFEERIELLRKLADTYIKLWAEQFERAEKADAEIKRLQEEVEILRQRGNNYRTRFYEQRELVEDMQHRRKGDGELR